VSTDCQSAFAEAKFEVPEALSFPSPIPKSYSSSIISKAGADRHKFWVEKHDDAATRDGSDGLAKSASVEKSQKKNYPEGREERERER
jgi:hypothetical protein